MNHRRLLAGILLGAGTGFVARSVAPGAAWLKAFSTYVAEPAGQIFLRLLFMLVVPLIFSALVVGIGEMDLKGLGRLGRRTFAYALFVSVIAAGIGLLLANLFHPGTGSGGALLNLAQTGGAALPTASPALSPITLIVNMVPDNPIKAAASGDMLGIMVFSLIFGVALTLTRTEGAASLRSTLAGLNDTLMTCIGFVLQLAPIGVGALLFTMSLRLGTDLLRPLAGYVGVVLLGLSLHMFVVYSLLLKFIARRSPLQFFRDTRLALLTAFSTSSSSATLPTALKVADENLRLPRAGSRFVLTVGSTMNQNGTALYEGITVLFLAQISGVSLSLSQQGLVMVICVLAGIGTAGVPGGSLPALALILKMLGIPPEGLGLIFGVDRLLDMCRTTLNVAGDLVVAACVTRDDEA